MLGNISGPKKIYIVCGYAQIDWVSVPLSKTGLRWIRHLVHPSSSVEEDGTGLKRCSVNRMVLS